MKAYCCILLASAAVLSAAPVIRELHPRGAQRGKTFTLTVRGEGLVPGARIETTLAAGISRLGPARDLEKPDTELPFLIELKPDAKVGLYPVRIVTDDGLSNVALFAVGDLPEQDENEAKNPKQSNGTQVQAEAVRAPVLVNGTLTIADIDLYSLQAKAGEKLVFEVEARRAGSAVDPAIELLDSTGRLLAKNDDGAGIGVDARLEYAFTKAGQYYVQLHDSRYSDQAVNFYRLKMAAYSYATGLFPLGWRRGEAVDVAMVGGNLPQPVRQPVLMTPDLAAKSRFVPVQLAGSPTLPFFFVVSDSPEALEPETGSAVLNEGVILNGRILNAGEVDRFRLAVEPGQQWMFELTAASLGSSQLDALLSLYDGSGKKLASRDDLGGADPALPFTVPAGLTELTVAVEDLLGRGGAAFGYRLMARRGGADFTVELNTPFVNVPAGGTAQIVATVQRRGYDGPIRLTIPNLPPGYHVAGGSIPSDAAGQAFNTDNAGYRTARAVLTLTAEPEVAERAAELSLVAVAEGPAGRMERIAQGPGMVLAVRGDRQRAFTAPWLELALPMALSRPLPVTLEAPARQVRISQGFEYELDYRVRKRGMRTTTRVRNQQSGSVGNIRILQGPPAKSADAGSILVSTNFYTPAEAFDMILETTADVDGKQVVVYAPAVRVEIVHGYQLRLEKPEMKLAPGGRAELRGVIFREPTFEGGLVQIRAEELPEKVHCDTIEVPGDQREFALACRAEPDAAPGAYQVLIASSAPDTGRKAKDTYKIPEVAARLVIDGAAQASR